MDTVQYNQNQSLGFDEMNEVEKLRHQMFKVNRRITKLERINLDLEKSNKYSMYISAAAFTVSLYVLLFRY